MTKNIAKKKSDIKKKDVSLDQEDFYIFHPPNKNHLYTEDEVSAIVQQLRGVKIPETLSTVQKSQWVKYLILDLMGYKKPTGLRTHQARKNKPKFINQLMDIFVQSRSNLQVWNYIPYDDNIVAGDWNDEEIRFSDCRYVIVVHDKQGNITHAFVKIGEELGEWDATGTRTIKWQANAPLKLRHESKVIIDYEDPLFDHYPQSGKSTHEKIRLIDERDKEDNKILVKSSPDQNTLLSLKEIGGLIQPLLSYNIKNPGTGQERIIGQHLEKEVAKLLGYSKFTQTDTGAYPDLLHQLLEVKFQYSGTIDLGKHLPTDPKNLPDSWNLIELPTECVRYCVFLMGLKEDRFITQAIILVSGKNFPRYFNICTGTNFKVQLPIPKSVFVLEEL